jgi:hypothetical protein
MKGCSGSDNQGLQKRVARGAAAQAPTYLVGGAKCPWAPHFLTMVGNKQQS